MPAKRNLAPVVSGISPLQGPPGLKITLHGENLGINENDIELVEIGRHNCTFSLEWISPNRIKVRVGPESGNHDIVVVTRSGGRGQSDVQFRCLSMTVGPLEESAVWVEEQHYVSATQKKQSYAQPEESNENAYGFDLSNILGLADEDQVGLSEEVLTNLFPDKSGNLLSDNFDPLWYLLEHYKSASVDDMRRGLQFLKEAQGENTTGSVSFRKRNLQLYLESHSLMNKVIELIRKDNAATDGIFETKNLDTEIKKCIARADDLFSNVLKRKEDADAQRLSLELINKNEFLFSLPSNIEGAMKRNDFDLIISYYRRRRVEPLLCKSNSKIFRELNSKIDDKLQKVREYLVTKLHTLPTSFEDQRKYIRYLTDLDTPGDVAWALILRYKSFFDTEMVDVKNKFNKPDGDKIRDKVAYIIELKQLFTATFAPFWRLGQCYFTGNLLLNETGRSEPADVSKFSQFKEMVDNVMQLYCNLVRAVFTPRSFENFSSADKDRYGVWTADFDVPTFITCVHQVRTSVLFLHRLPEALPATAIDLIDALAIDIRCECMRFTFDQTIATVRRLHEREAWIVEVTDSNGAVTELPRLFEQLVTDMVQQLTEVSSRLPTADSEQDAEIFRDFLVAKEAKSWLIQIFQAFAAAIENASKGKSQKHSDNDARLLCANNAHVTAVQIIPRVVEILHRKGIDFFYLSLIFFNFHTILTLGYQLLGDIKKAAVDVFEALALRLLNDYIESKITSDVLGKIEQRMYATTDFSWTSVVPPTSPSPYIVQALFDACSLRFNVARLSPFGLKTVMVRLAVEITDEVIRLFKCIVECNSQALVQQRLDLAALLIIFEKWLPEQSKKVINKHMEHVLKLSAEQASRVDILVKRFSLQHALLCSSFA